MQDIFSPTTPNRVVIAVAFNTICTNAKDFIIRCEYAELLTTRTSLPLSSNVFLPESVGRDRQQYHKKGLSDYKSFVGTTIVLDAPSVAR